MQKFEQVNLLVKDGGAVSFEGRYQSGANLLALDSPGRTMLLVKDGLLIDVDTIRSLLSEGRVVVGEVGGRTLGVPRSRRRRTLGGHWVGRGGVEGCSGVLKLGVVGDGLVLVLCQAAGRYSLMRRAQAVVRWIDWLMSMIVASFWSAGAGWWPPGSRRGVGSNGGLGGGGASRSRCPA